MNSGPAHDQVDTHLQQPILAEMLERAGHRIRGRRADCIRCEGHSRLTVSFNNEVAYCHRCQWTANVRTLARSIGVNTPSPSAADMAKRKLDAEFKEWENTCYMLLMRRLWFLERRAVLAKQVLHLYPDCEPAWAVLADLCHSEAHLSAAFELLAYEKVPTYLAEPMTRARLRAAFDDVVTRSSRAA